ncbi:hypothetical protein Tco_0032574 [Tanacetum coccineum]
MDLEASASSKERKLTDLNALVTLVKSQNYNLVDWVHELEVSSSGLQEKITVCENCMDQHKKFQDDRMKVVNDKFDKLYTDFVEMALHLGEKFYPHLFTTISGRRWLLTHCMELAIVNCLNSLEYLSTLGASIGKAIEKGMQDGLSAGITHGKEGRVLTDVAADNPSAEVDYIYALQQLQNVNFSLLARLKSNKDASVETVMDILCLEGPLTEKLGSTFVVLSVGMPISTGMTASVTYVNENGVSPLLDFIMAIELFSIIRDNFSWESESTDNVVPHNFFDLIASDGCNQFRFNPLCEVVNSYYQEFDFPRSFWKMSGYVNSPFKERPLRRDWSKLLLWIPWNRVSSVSSSTNTCLLKCAKLVDAILLSTLAFLFPLLGICLIDKTLKLLVPVLDLYSLCKTIANLNKSKSTIFKASIRYMKLYAVGFLLYTKETLEGFTKRVKG